MNTTKAVSFVEDNVGECVTINKISEADNGVYIAIAYRPNAPFNDRQYSTHLVNDSGCCFGHYDMSNEQAWKDFIERCN